jgi:hypothetical protein
VRSEVGHSSAWAESMQRGKLRGELRGTAKGPPMKNVAGCLVVAPSTTLVHVLRTRTRLTRRKRWVAKARGGDTGRRCIERGVRSTYSYGAVQSQFEIRGRSDKCEV